MMMEDINITVYELVNPARCEVCRESAEFHVVVDDVDHYYCFDHLPTLASVVINKQYGRSYDR